MGRDGGSCGGRVFEILFAALVLCVFMSQLFIGNLTSAEAKGGEAAAITPSANLRHVMFVGRKRHSIPGNPDLIAANKRRVPNGPDPIHNRHVGEAWRPPGRA